MAHPQVALGRPVGKLDTDSSGLARYTLQIEIPKGRGHGNEPYLSFEYSQGAPNGTLGVGWVLGGLSAIRLGPGVLAFDNINDTPHDFDRFSARLSLDGNLLLNTRGEYFSPDADYRTEIDSLDRVVSVCGQGFVVRDSTGQWTEYGTTLDSRSSTSDGSAVIEWRVKRQLDPFGNCVTFNYEQGPDPVASNLHAISPAYLSAIAYTSNDKTGLKAKRLISLEYMDRDDAVVQCVYGERVAWTKLLKAVHIGLVQDPVKNRARSYEINYVNSPTTSATYLSSLTEIGYKDGKGYRLQPTTFTYQGFKDLAQSFQPPEQGLVSLPSASNTVMAMNLNISGRGMADLVCLSYDYETRDFSLNTFLANRADERIGHGSAINWQASTSAGAVAELPFIDINYVSKMFGADLNGDGRTDLIIPYESDTLVNLSVSKSVGTGFEHYKILETNLPWNANSIFKAMDLTGRGTSEVVHIFASGENLALRTYPHIENEDGVGLQAGEILYTEDSFENTIDWLQVTTQRTGAKCLVRVWQKNVGSGLSQLQATTYTLQDPVNPGLGFIESSISVLREASYLIDESLSVLACDINADGVEDIVTCTVATPGSSIVFMFNTFLGDGLGNFAPLGDAVERRFDVESPIREGSFHVANFLGSQSADLAYVGQEQTSGDIVAFIAQGTSSGLIGKMAITRVVSNVDFQSPQISSSDLNGSGVGDFFIHSIENGILTIMNAYNVNEPSDLMISTVSPLGMRTDVNYVPLTDPSVYHSSTMWDDFQPLRADSNPILGAPNLVVSSITHSNDTSVNSISFSSSLKKVYKDARTSRLGRGWQGFASITTSNFFEGADPVIVDEEFEQDFPLTGIKTRIVTKTSSGAFMKSEKTAYQHSRVRLGRWNIFRIDRASERADMFDLETVGRTIGKDFDTDSSGNIIRKREFETHGGHMIHQSWELYTYTTLNGMSGLPTSKKWTSREGNLDQSKYEEGDFSFVTYTYDSKTGTLEEAREWSSDVNSFATTKTKFDDCGNEISCQVPSGLLTTTTYDNEYQTLPIKVVQKGHGVFHVQLSAYDKVTGLPVAHRDANGLLTCVNYDAFGRSTQSKGKSVESSEFSQPALEFLGPSASLLDDDLATELTGSLLDPQKDLRYEKVTTNTNSTYLCAVSVLQAGSDPAGRTDIVEAVNCANKTCRRSTRHGKTPRTWKYWHHNLQGLQVLESFPMHLPPTVQEGSELDFTPDPEGCTRMAYNAISQPVEMVRPSRTDTGISYFVVSKLEYQNGGATTLEKKYRREGQSDKLLSATSRTSVLIAEKEYVTEVIDESELKSTFTYDAAGRLIACRDAGGKTETRTYNTRGQIVTLDNLHQNMLTNSRSVATHRAYDIAGRLLAETNSLGESTEYESDGKMRPLRKLGHNGRTVVYTYDENGFETLSSVTTYAPLPTDEFETKISYEYDSRGRGSSKAVSFADGTTYNTSVGYDWQDKAVKVTLPDGAIINKQWQGNLISSIGIGCPSSQHWNVEAKVTSYSPFDKPQACQISGNTFTQQFLHEYAYDIQGFPLKHNLTASVPLVQNHYLYGDLDQLQRVHEFGSGETTDYTYSGKRLVSSQIGNGPTTAYTYDSSGNLTSRDTTTMIYGTAGVRGVENGRSMFDIGYDGAGRMVSRQTPEAHISFKYDGFGGIASMTDVTTNETTTLVSDGEGQMVRRVQSDGSQEIFINKNYSIMIKTNGQRSIRYALFNNEELIATIMMDESSASSSAAPPANIRVHYSNTKNNVTHTFNANDESSRTKLRYDDYGLLRPRQEQNSQLHDDLQHTYEARYLDEKSGLLNFGGRWYDPLVCRFVTPDDITDPTLLLASDGMNRHAFENNDPINHIDPSGHWSTDAIGGFLAGAAMIGLASLLTFATGGAAAPALAVMVSAALTSGGIAGVFYSVQHSNEKDSGKFWAGWGMTVAVNAAVGAVTSGITLGVSALSGYSAALQRLSQSTKWAVDAFKYKSTRVAARMIGAALLGGGGAVLTKAAGRWVGNTVYGKNDDVWGNAGWDFLQGFGTSLAVSGGMEIFSRYGDRAKESLSATWDTKMNNPSFSEVYSNNKLMDITSMSTWKVPNGSGGLFMPSGKVVYF
ncbi:hypothetical protein G7Z17_g1848 [Cylindrodendrum hubeiense]|uniref:Insecticide toxin TcdB middle/N-terminal domain-containing protein n=1 Tax=Cylindrodendrum hubeiense TaxID=595255 RepID=A0A9P5HM70_9HYPO|nr:hypothetical protein G7Z17_g1848 [Cylindrodendrum hubeiense]